MATRSISQGITYAELKPDFQSILNVLPDNTQKLISPRDVRDSLYTLWENSVFKITNVSTSEISHIGIDQIWLTQKVYFGKKRLGGKEIMTDQLLKEDVDFYFYNTKAEPQESYNTKIAFLAGTGSFYNPNSELGVPTIESKVVQTGSGNSYINFEIKNNATIFDGPDLIGGDINIISERGNISLNSFKFPKIVENASQTNDGKYLKFVWDGISAGYATWSAIETPDLPEIPDPVDPTAIYFTDPTPTPQTLGGILEGSTFTDVPVTEMFRRLLYPYLRPTLSSGFGIGSFESGDTARAAQQTLSYKFKRIAVETLQSLTLSGIQYTGTLLDPTSTAQGQERSGSVIPIFSAFLPATENAKSFSVSFELIDSKGTKVPSSAGFSIYIPYFYGTAPLVDITTAGINGLLQTNRLTKVVAPPGGAMVFRLSTQGLTNNKGCVYFGYPSNYGDVTMIKDSSNLDVRDAFRKFEIENVAAPNGWWGGPSENRRFKFYVYAPRNIDGSLGPPAITGIPAGTPYTFTI